MTNALPPDLLPERNPVTQKKHRREVLRQITVPFVIGLLVLIAACILSALGSAGQVSKWADASLIWILFPMLFAGLIGLAVVGGIAFGVIKLIEKLPQGMRRLQDAVASLGALVRKATDLLVEPVLRLNSWGAASRTARRKLTRR